MFGLTIVLTLKLLFVFLLGHLASYSLRNDLKISIYLIQPCKAIHPIKDHTLNKKMMRVFFLNVKLIPWTSTPYWTQEKWEKVHEHDKTERYQQKKIVDMPNGPILRTKKISATRKECEKKWVCFSESTDQWVLKKKYDIESSSNFFPKNIVAEIFKILERRFFFSSKMQTWNTKQLKTCLGIHNTRLQRRYSSSQQDTGSHDRVQEGKSWYGLRLASVWM